MSSYDDLYGTKYLSAGEVARPTTAVIDRIEEETFVRPGEPPRTKKVLYVKGGKKGIVINKTNAANLAAVFGKDFAAWPGQRITVQAEPTSFAGKRTMGLRLYPAANGAPPAPAVIVTPPPLPSPKTSVAEEMNDEIPW
jgi:hypothetical protein